MLRPKGFMTDEVIDALIANLAKYHIKGIRFSRWGEPTLHPKFIEIIRRTKSAGALVHFNTNGSQLDENMIEALLDAGLDSIKFSFQGADEGTYNEMREGGDYERLLGIVRTMYELRGSRSSPYIQISTTLTAETAEQVESFKRDVGAYCDYYNIGFTKLNHLDVSAMNVSDEEKAKILALQENERVNHVYRSFCPEAFDKLSVNWNGDVTLCCQDYDNFMIVGNILDMDIEEIFTSHAANFYREIIAKKQYGRIRCCSFCYETVPLHK